MNWANIEHLDKNELILFIIQRKQFLIEEHHFTIFVIKVLLDFVVVKSKVLFDFNFVKVSC